MSKAIKRVWLLLGVGAVLLAGAPSQAAFPGAWNGAIAYSRDDGVKEEIWVMDEQGDGEHVLLPGTPTFHRYAPAWSADGSTIAHQSNTCSPVCNGYRIAAARIDGSKVSTGVDGEWGLFLPTWSPDGSMLAFIAHDYQGRTEVLRLQTVVIATGVRHTVIEFPSHAIYAPSWSPDGTRIAFVMHGDVYTIRPDGSGLARLTYGGDSFFPDWSPDGSQIAFTSSRDGSWEVYVMDANGANQTRLTAVPGDDFDPAWSPDGTKIAFVHTLDDQDDIAIMDRDGSHVRNLTESSEIERSPSWQPILAFVPCATARASRVVGVSPPRVPYHPVLGTVEATLERFGAPARNTATQVHDVVASRLGPVNAVAYSLC